MDYAICSYLVHAPKGLDNEHSFLVLIFSLGFINLNKLNKCFALVTLLLLAKKKKKMTARGATELREFANKGTEAICIFTPN